MDLDTDSSVCSLNRFNELLSDLWMSLSVSGFAAILLVVDRSAEFALTAPSLEFSSNFLRKCGGMYFAGIAE